jgi:hypothetical protein
MKSFRIEREYLEKGTRGECFDGDTFLFHTIERPNLGEITCIEEGWYTAKRYYSPLNKCLVWLLQNVPGKTFIELHIANWPHELLGCIAPGKDIQTSPTGEPGVISSGIAFHEFMALTADEEEIAFQIVEKK